MEILKKLKDSGVDVEKHIDKHKFLHSIPFILDELISSIREDYIKAGVYKYKIKHELGPIIAKCERYDSFFWKEIANKSELAATQYGDLATLLFKQLIDSDVWTKYLKNGKMTNKEKALNMLVDSFAYQSELGEEVKKAIKLASKPDWFHPSKGEFPNDGELILEVSNTIGDDIPDLHKYYDEDKTLFLEECKVWCYLPVYKEDQL